jgi:hypothetical protein
MEIIEFIVVVFKKETHAFLQIDCHTKGELYMDYNGWGREDGNQFAEALNTKMLLRGFELRVPTKEN